MKWRRGLDPIDGVLLVALVLVVLAVTRAYVTSERFFYYWDHALFQDLAETTASTFTTPLRFMLRAHAGY